MPGRASGAEAMPNPPPRRDGAGVKPPDLRRAGRRKILQPTLSGNHGLLHSPTPGAFSMRIRLCMRQPLFIGRFRLSIHGLTIRCTVAQNGLIRELPCPPMRPQPVHFGVSLRIPQPLRAKKISVWAKSRPKRYCILKIFCYTKSRYPHGVGV